MSLNWITNPLGYSFRNFGSPKNFNSVLEYRRLSLSPMMKKLYFVLSGISAILLASPASADLFNSPVDQLPTEQRVMLRKGQPLVTGEKGTYTARLLVNASPELAWSVLTDYANSSKFMPNVVSSQVLSANGNQKVIEQVDARQIFLMNVRSRIRSAVTETAKQRIDFRQIEGDLQSMQGYWKLEPVAPYKGAQPNQVLITQVIEVEPKSGTPKDIFYGIFRESLGEGMSAIAKEVSRRMK